MVLGWHLISQKMSLRFWKFSMNLSHPSSGLSHLAQLVSNHNHNLHSNDNDMLASLNEYSGFLVARGYREESIKFHLSAMANRSRSIVLNGDYKHIPKFAVPMVSTLHPATTVLTKVVRTCFSEASDLDNLIGFLIPKSSLLVSYRKLPNLQLLMCKNDQNQLAISSPTPSVSGYSNIGCKCMESINSPSKKIESWWKEKENEGPK